MNKTFLVKIGEEIHCGKCGDLLYLDANELAHHEKMDHVYFVNRQAYELEDIKAYSLSTQGGHLDLEILQAGYSKEWLISIPLRILLRCIWTRDSRTISLM